MHEDIFKGDNSNLKLLKKYNVATWQNIQKLQEVDTKIQRRLKMGENMTINMGEILIFLIKNKPRKTNVHTSLTRVSKV